MKKIVYTTPDGGIAVVGPFEGARLALAIVLADGSKLASTAPQPVDRFLRQWPVAGATATWAESEDEFLSRIRAKDVPASATNVRFVDESEIPVDRTYRDAWTLGVTGIEVDAVKVAAITAATKA